MWLVLLVIFSFLWFMSLRESFDTLPNSFDNYKVVTTKEQRLLNFLGDLNDSMHAKLPRTGPFMGSCDDKVNEEAKRQSLKEAYDKITKYTNNFKQDNCVAKATYLCEFTRPEMYLAEGRFPPRWVVPTYANTELPKYTDLHCYNTFYDCCYAGTHHTSIV